MTADKKELMILSKQVHHHSPLLLLIFHLYCEWHPSKANWAERKEASVFVSAIDIMFMLLFIICLKSSNLFLFKLILN